MNPIPLRTVLSVTVILIIASLSPASCDKKPVAAAPADPKSSAAPASVAAPRVVDWSKIQPTDAGEAIMSYKTLARHCDAWFKGTQTDITLRYDGAAAADSSGHTMAMSPEAWKGIVEAVRKSPAPTFAVASKSAMYSKPSPQSDTFGTLPRYKYQLDIVDDGTLKLHNAGKLDDGI